ncbi:MAG TPA: hypothetical protein VL995_10000 [Cellvibrio sp.]|nr:hypothetical protein [Cellvibrio sp.]
MNNHLINSFLIGCVITTGLLGSYFIQRKRLEPRLWLKTALLAAGIGAILATLVCAGSAVFSTGIALGFAAIMYLSPHAKQNEKLEQLLVSTAGGILIGLVSMIGFIMCCYRL